jgi:hypothetical protein
MAAIKIFSDLLELRQRGKSRRKIRLTTTALQKIYVEVGTE